MGSALRVDMTFNVEQPQTWLHTNPQLNNVHQRVPMRVPTRQWAQRDLQWLWGKTLRAIHLLDAPCLGVWPTFPCLNIPQTIVFPQPPFGNPFRGGLGSNILPTPLPEQQQQPPLLTDARNLSELGLRIQRRSRNQSQ